MAKIAKGEVRNPNGRPKGTHNKATKELKDVILKALDKAGGVKYLTDQAKLNPAAFMSLIGKIIPKDINANINVMDALADRLNKARERTSKS